MRKAMRTFGRPPSLGELDELARRALASLPAPFRRHLHGLILCVEDFADDETLRSVGVNDKFELTGIYEGVPLGEKSVEAPAAMPDRIRLFRRPILDEWAGGLETLERLVRHVLIHEVGHQFGLSDADMDAIEGAA
jgi:predicted Zn-dependent protease with MMP-like domain